MTKTKVPSSPGFYVLKHPDGHGQLDEFCGQEIEPVYVDEDRSVYGLGSGLTGRPGMPFLERAEWFEMEAGCPVGKLPAGWEDMFDEFWRLYPKGPRKTAKPQCRAKYKAILKRGVDHGEIMAGLTHMKQTPDWLKEGGQYIPGPHPFLNKEMWVIEDIEGEQVDAPVPTFGADQ